MKKTNVFKGIALTVLAFCVIIGFTACPQGSNSNKKTETTVFLPNTMVEVIPASTTAGVTVEHGEPTDGKWKVHKDGVVHTGPVTVMPFKIANSEVSYRLWKEVYDWATGPTGGAGQPAESYVFSTPGQNSGATDDHPVTMIDWNDCIIWCNAYTEKTKGIDDCVYRTGSNDVLRDATMPTVWDFYSSLDESKMAGKKGWRLPTDAEWEFAARGGDPTAPDWAFKYAGSNNLDEVGWSSDNSGGTAHPCGKKKPNRLGLYDMTGNVDEFLFSPYNSGGHAAHNHPMRGGSFNLEGSNVELSGARLPSNSPYDDTGFRLACSF